MNVIRVVADTFRRDRLGACGNDYIRTPALDGLARGGTLSARRAWKRGLAAGLRRWWTSCRPSWISWASSARTIWMGARFRRRCATRRPCRGARKIHSPLICFMENTGAARRLARIRIHGNWPGLGDCISPILRLRSRLIRMATVRSPRSRRPRRASRPRGNSRSAGCRLCTLPAD